MAISSSGMLSGKLRHKDAARRREPAEPGGPPHPPPPALPGKPGTAALTSLPAVFRVGTGLLSGRWGRGSGGAGGRQAEPRGLPATSGRDGRAGAGGDAAPVPRASLRGAAGPGQELRLPPLGKNAPPTPPPPTPPNTFLFPGYKQFPPGPTRDGRSHQLVPRGTSLGAARAPLPLLGGGQEQQRGRSPLPAAVPAQAGRCPVRTAAPGQLRTLCGPRAKIKIN